jgi:hypothetical protein
MLSTYYWKYLKESMKYMLCLCVCVYPLIFMYFMKSTYCTGKILRFYLQLHKEKNGRMTEEQSNQEYVVKMNELFLFLT